MILEDIFMINIEEEFKKIGKKAKMIRIEKGLSQIEVAKRLDVAQTHLSNIENGRSHVSLKKLFELANVLECPVVSFFKFEDDKHKDTKDNVKIADIESLESLLKLLRK